MTDYYRQAKGLFAEVRSTVNQIQSQASELERLQAQSMQSDENDAYAPNRQQEYQRRQQSIQNSLSGLQNKLDSSLQRLADLASKLEGQAKAYQQDSYTYARARQQADLYGVREKMGQAGQYSQRYADERAAQAREIKEFIAWARSQASVQSGPAASRSFSSFGSIDDLLPVALTGRKSGHQSEYASSCSYQSGLESCFGKYFSQYTPGSYSLSYRREYSQSHTSMTGGMPWY